MQNDESSLDNVRPVLVALESIPRKKECMSNSPEVSVDIATGKTNKIEGPLYYITVEVTSATDIVSEVFVVTRRDEAVNAYSFSRVASLEDIQSYGTSPINQIDGYRVSSFTIETNSLSFIKEVREGIQLTLQSLLDSVKNSIEVSDIEQVTTVTITGETY